MGKVAQKDRSAKTPKQKRRIRGSDASNKYLKPGALAQLRNNKALATKLCADLGKKRVAEEKGNDVVLQDNGGGGPVVLSGNDVVLQDNGGGPVVLSPERVGYGSRIGALDLVKQNNLPLTPRTPRTDGCLVESTLESLPMDLLVKILCHLHHDQLRAVFHVSQRIRKATVIARQHHFNYTTPDRSRQEMLRTITPLPNERWPFLRNADGTRFMPTPKTPKAPKHGPRPPSRIRITEMRQITTVLFQEPAYPARCAVPSVTAKPPCKPFASNRVLFCEDDLCKAVAQNKLR